MTKQLNLSKEFSFPAVDYAGQGNAILGIRDAGKTYTAMKAAESLLDAGIPIIVYDPVGVWKNLKVGVSENEGYQIVVAGGEGSDVRLTKANATDIVRAAMKENISLVIDLYSPELINKSTWISIVQETVDVLMYENKSHGIRHIFIEEAAEFIPQRLQPQHSKVYASLERLARMGRNAQLGYTLINQRAEEVNKAILEISALSLLHKQIGKNSLTSIQKWLELLQIDNEREIVKSLPTLKQGQCWAIGQTLQPQLIQVEPRKTFHPNPKQPIQADQLQKSTVGVETFVKRLQSQLQEQPVPDAKIKTVYSDTSKLQTENAALQKEVKHLKACYNALLQNCIDATKQLNHAIQDKGLAPVPAVQSKVAVAVSAKPIQLKQRLAKCPATIINFLAQFGGRSFSKAQVGIATGYSPNSGGFNNALSELNTAGLLVRDGGRLRSAPMEEVHKYIIVEPQEYSIETYRSKLQKCEREIYDVLLRYPGKSFNKQSLADSTDSQYSPISGGFNNALSTLSTLELVKRENGQIQLNPELVNLI